MYTYDQSQYNILYEKNLTSSVVIKNYYADGLQLGEAVGSSTYYMIDDALGNIRDVTTSTVSTVFSSDYMPYGKNYDLFQSLSALNFEYTHKPYDSVTGLYYYGERFYDPSINRFITEDGPQYVNIMNPLSLNRYSYVLNNPETMNDPTGSVAGFPTGGVSGFSGACSGTTLQCENTPNNNQPSACSSTNLWACGIAQAGLGSNSNSGQTTSSQKLLFQQWLPGWL